MKAQELRLGNFVLSKNKIDEVIGLSNISCFLKNQNVIGIQFIKPIPITEEWLLKFGFYKGKKGWNKTLKNKTKFNLYMHSSHSINHLQNLYYALTLEELTLQND